MKVGDLPQPIVASKSDWLAGDSWLGFSPAVRAARKNSVKARAACESTIQRQCSGGYVLEYITATFGKPARGYERHPKYLADKARHHEIAGRLIAVHKLRHTSRPLIDIMERAAFDNLQDIWDHSGTRDRWSVAFPIVESFEIEGWPLAKEVFDEEAYRRIYRHSSGTLRPILPSEAAQLADLPIRRSEALNAWIAIEDELEQASLSEIDGKTLRDIGRDIPASALEGLPEERRALVKKRAAWLAARFVRERQRNATMHCDNCGFDPAGMASQHQISARSLLDAHHKNPLAEGQRRTTILDFSLLCPTCHRLEHRLLSKGHSLFT